MTAYISVQLINHTTQLNTITTMDQFAICYSECSYILCAVVDGCYSQIDFISQWMNGERSKQTEENK